MMMKFLTKFKGYKTCVAGATGMEYGLIAAVVGTGLVGSLTLTGGGVSDNLRNVQIVLQGGNWISAKATVTDASATEVFDAVNFEDPNTPGFARTTALAGWDLTGAGEIDLFQDGLQGLNAPGNTSMIDMRSGFTNSGISRDMESLVSGQDYVLTFDASNSAGGGRQTALEVVIGGEVVDTITPPADRVFYNQQIAFTAGAYGDGSNTVELREVGTYDGPRGTLVANIEIGDP